MFPVVCPGIRFQNARLALRRFYGKVELLDDKGDTCTTCPAKSLWRWSRTGSAEVAQANGRIRAVKLIETAATHPIRIGEPSNGTWHSPPFVVRERLDGGGITLAASSEVPRLRKLKKTSTFL